MCTTAQNQISSKIGNAHCSMKYIVADSQTAQADFCLTSKKFNMVTQISAGSLQGRLSKKGCLCLEYHQLHALRLCPASRTAAPAAKTGINIDCTLLPDGLLLACSGLHCRCWPEDLTPSLEPELLSDVSDSVLLTKEGVPARGAAWAETP